MKLVHVLLVWSIASVAVAQDFPESPFFPTEERECQVLANKYESLSSEYLQQSLACDGDESQQVPVGGCCEEAFGDAAHVFCMTSRGCEDIKATLSCVRVQRKTEVEQCYQNVRIYKNSLVAAEKAIEIWNAPTPTTSHHEVAAKTSEVIAKLRKAAGVPDPRAKIRERGLKVIDKRASPSRS